MPERVDGAGRSTGGGPFSRGHLYKILGNPLYVGQLRHKGQVHEGQHPAIVDGATWQAVQEGLAANHHRHYQRRAASAHLLIGRIQDAQGRTISPTHAQKGRVRYRYYVGRAAAQVAPSAVSDGASAPVLRLPAARLEAAVVGTLRGIIPAEAQADSDAALVAEHLRVVIVHPDRLDLQLTGDRPPITIPFSHEPQQRRREIVVPPDQTGERLRPMKSKDRDRILSAIAKGRAWMQDLIAGHVAGTDAIAARESVTERSVRMTLSLAHLAPSIVRGIVEARLPRGIGLRHLSELPPAWAEQERILGI